MNLYSQEIDVCFGELSNRQNLSIYEAKSIEVIKKKLKKYFTDTEVVVEELGLASFHFKCKLIKEKLETFCNEANIQSKQASILTVLSDIMKDLEKLHSKYLNDTKFLINNEIDKNILYQMTSVKVKDFLNKLKQAYEIQNINSHSIVFVERRETAYVLNEILNNLSDGEWSFIKSGFILGSNDDIIKMTSKDQVFVILF